MNPIISAATISAILFAAAGTWADDAVVARVNGTPITETQVTELEQRLASQGGAEAAAASPEANREVAVHSLIGIEVLNQVAKAEQVEASPAEVDEQVNKLKGQYPSSEAFQQALTESHATEADLRRDIARGLTAEKLVERHISVKLAANAAEQFYKENPDKFRHSVEVRASHILFRATAENDAAAKQRAEETLARLKKGEDFGKLAKDLSEDPGSAKNGGDLGFFAREAMVKPFADAAFGLTKGQLSGVVQTPFGFHIIKVTDTREAGIMPLADVKEQVQNFLEEQERDHQEQAYIDGLTKKAKIEFVEPKKDGPPPDTK